MGDEPAPSLDQHDSQVQGDGQAIAGIVGRGMDVAMMAMAVVIVTAVAVVVMIVTLIVVALVMGVIVAVVLVVIVRMGGHANSGAYRRRSIKISHAVLSRQPTAVADAGHPR
jgi:hypothetical protein